MIRFIHSLMIPIYTSHLFFIGIATLCRCWSRIHLNHQSTSRTPRNSKHHIDPDSRGNGTYPSLLTRSLIRDSDESSVVEQTFICATFWLLLFLLFLDFGSLRLDFTSTGERAVLFTLLMLALCTKTEYYHDGRDLRLLVKLMCPNRHFRKSHGPAPTRENFESLDLAPIQSRSHLHSM